MSYSFLEAIANDYSSCEMDFTNHEKTEGERQFTEKYIKPVMQKNRNDGYDMEACFHGALADAEDRDFMNGFKACMRFMVECLQKDD